MRQLKDNTVHLRVGDRLVVQKNLRMRRSILLVAEQMLGSGAPGVTHIALGSGIGSGTLTLPQAPTEGADELRQEFHREPVTSVTFHDLDNDIGDTYTDGSRSNRILVECDVAAADSESLITEFGLFGGTSQQDMLAWVTFPVIDNRQGGDNPDAPEDISFSWLLTFPFIQPGGSE